MGRFSRGLHVREHILLNIIDVDLLHHCVTSLESHACAMPSPPVRMPPTACLHQTCFLAGLKTHGLRHCVAAMLRADNATPDGESARKVSATRQDALNMKKRVASLANAEEGLSVSHMDFEPKWLRAKTHTHTHTNLQILWHERR